ISRASRRGAFQIFFPNHIGTLDLVVPRLLASTALLFSTHDDDCNNCNYDGELVKEKRRGDRE
ncbi:hypothetical protein ALC62_09674, partial [Cyphomyrmex costatus]